MVLETLIFFFKGPCKKGPWVILLFNLYIQEKKRKKENLFISFMPQKVEDSNTFHVQTHLYFFIILKYALSKVTSYYQLKANVLKSKKIRLIFFFF